MAELFGDRHRGHHEICVQHSTAVPITVCGSFGMGNGGDEAAWLALGDLAQLAERPIHMSVLSRFREPLMPEVIGLGARDAERIARLHQSYLLLVGGGVVEPTPACVLLRCSAAFRSLEPTSTSLFAASMEQGVKYPFLIRRNIIRELRRMTQVFWRDDRSAQVARSTTGIRGEVIGDIVLALRPAPLPLSHKDLPERFVVVALAPRWSSDQSWRSWITTQLARVAQELRAALVFVPFSTHHDDDRPEHRAIAEQIGRLMPSVRCELIDTHLNPREVASLFSKSILAIGMRLHACVISFAQEVPCLALAYHPKVRAFAETAGIAEWCVPEESPVQQTGGAYGYSFAQSGLAGCDLAAAARHAIDGTCFSRLPSLKRRLVDAFRVCISDSD
jgi:polysaccharide pyruvyl transferase WcaK-like protein